MPFGRRPERRFLKAESAPADRRVQDPRRLRRGRVAAARRAGPRRHHLLVGQPRPGRRPRGAAARRAVRRRHAVGRAGDQARAGRGGRRRDRRRRDGQRRAPGGRRAHRRGARPRDHPAVRRRPDHRRPGHGRARDRRGRCRTSPRSSSRSAAAGSASGVATAVRALAPGARVIGVEPELAADAQAVARGRRDRPLAGRRSSRGRSPTGRGPRRSAGGRSPTSRRCSTTIVTVTEAEIAAAVRLAAEESRLVVEPSGALTRRRARVPGARGGPGGPRRPVVAVVSGGNVDPERYRAFLEAPIPAGWSRA